MTNFIKDKIIHIEPEYNLIWDNETFNEIYKHKTRFALDEIPKHKPKKHTI